MSAVAQLKAVLGMDPGNYKAGMRDAQGATKTLQKSISSVGRTLGAAFSVGAIVMATKKVIGLASEIRHAADNLEISTDEFQGLTASALKYGVAVEGITKALGKLATSQGKVSEGDKEYIDSLKLLNIEQGAFIRANPAEALAMVAKGYANAENRAEAFSAVSDLVGRSGKNLTAFMKELADVGLQGVIDKAKEAGQVMTDELITKLELLGTKNEQIILRMQVGWANFINVVGGAAKAVGASTGSMIGDIQGVLKPLQKLAILMAAVNPGGAVAAAMSSGALDRATEAGAEAINEGAPELDPEKGMSAKGKAKTGAQVEEDSASEKKARQKAEKELQSAQKQNEKLRTATKEGLAKINAEHAMALRDITETRDRANANDNKALAAAMDERQKLLESKYAEDVKAFRAAQADKLRAARRDLDAMRAAQLEGPKREGAEQALEQRDIAGEIAKLEKAKADRIEKAGAVVIKVDTSEIDAAIAMFDKASPDAGEHIAELERQKAKMLEDQGGLTIKVDTSDIDALIGVLEDKSEVLRKGFVAEMQKDADAAAERIEGLKADQLQGGGRGVDVDRMARMGGQIGASRAGLGTADRQLKFARENNKIQRDIEKLTREMNEALQVIRDKAEGGGI